MRIRPRLAAAAMLLAFAAFLYWLYRAGRIGGTGITLIMLLGAAFVISTHYLYRKLWPDDED